MTRPSNFSWIVEGVLAGSAYPSKRDHFQFYLDNNIKHVISLTEWQPPIKLVPADINMVFMPVVEFEAPSIEQLEDFVQKVKNAEDNNEGVVCHCHWGRGRTGTMLAAYLIRHRDQSPHQAICQVRDKRPYSIETYEQEDVLFDYYELIRQKDMHRSGQENADSNNLESFENGIGESSLNNLNESSNCNEKNFPERDSFSLEGCPFSS